MLFLTSENLKITTDYLCTHLDEGELQRLTDFLQKLENQELKLIDINNFIALNNEVMQNITKQKEKDTMIDYLLNFSKNNDIKVLSEKKKYLEIL